jgi:hypothetical protein
MIVDLLVKIRAIINELSIAPEIKDKLLTDVEQAFFSVNGEDGGDFSGGDSGSGIAGNGVKATGGYSVSGTAGKGAYCSGGGSTGGLGGDGAYCRGGDSTGGEAGNGVTGIGGFSTGGAAGVGGYFQGGDTTSGTAGRGIVALGGTGTFIPKGAAGEFIGNVIISGTLTAGGGGIQIDHPSDPEHKFLNHSFVESPEMLNVYNGTVTLGDEGKAWVRLPEWFESLNKELRYQLTPIGVFAPLYIEQEIRDNQFRIGGGSPGGKVSWQITGVRKDKFAEAYRIPVEKEKPAEQVGKYLHPEVYGKSKADYLYAKYFLEPPVNPE